MTRRERLEHLRLKVSELLDEFDLVLNSWTTTGETVAETAQTFSETQ